jgi:phosphate transport system protein
MPREAFDRELQHLQNELLALGIMVGKAIVGSVEILKQRDLEAARQLIAGDRDLNKRRFSIEFDTLVLIATQQPMAGDLRTLAAVLEIASELERMGDYAKGIAKISIKMGSEPFIKPLIDIPRMAEKARDMLDRALKAFVERNVNLARAIALEDNEIDSLYERVFRELMTYVIADPKLIERASYLMWVAHNLERTADRVLNICERVVFTVTGEMVEMDEGEANESDLKNSPNRNGPKPE